MLSTRNLNTYLPLNRQYLKECCIRDKNDGDVLGEVKARSNGVLAGKYFKESEREVCITVSCHRTYKIVTKQ